MLLNPWVAPRLTQGWLNCPRSGFVPVNLTELSPGSGSAPKRQQIYLLFLTSFLFVKSLVQNMSFSYMLDTETALTRKVFSDQ